MRLDAKTIATLYLPPGKDDHIEWDSDLAGFGLRLRQGGKRVWVVQYRSPGSRRTRRVTLGSVKKLTPAQAREAARGLLARVVTGRDPQGEREAKRAQAARTFRNAVEAYLAAKQPELMAGFVPNHQALLARRRLFPAAAWNGRERDRSSRHRRSDLRDHSQP